MYQFLSSYWVRTGLMCLMVLHCLLALGEPSSTWSDPVGHRTITFVSYKTVTWVELSLWGVYVVELAFQAFVLGWQSFAQRKVHRLCVASCVRARRHVRVSIR